MNNINNNISWACIQPLTGGMYIGAQLATESIADFIIDYPGHQDIKTDKNGNIIDAANEVNLITYLKKHNICPAIYTFDRQMFQPDMDINPKFTQNGQSVVIPNKPLDLVVAVPVCSGLSNITIASDDTKAARNCNMIYITKYTLNTLKPKVYIFENAPTLVSDKGAEVRADLEEIARDAGYTIVYYKTDTVLHHNCQRRPRTFVMFIKWRGNDKGTPELQYEYEPIPVREYFNKISNDATQQIPFEMSDLNQLLIEFMKLKHGYDWRNKMKNSYAIQEVYRNGISGFDDFIEYIGKSTIEDKIKTKVINLLVNAKSKIAEGKNFYSATVTTYKDYTPSIQFKSLQCIVHHEENRLLTVREALWLMGLPDDFELLGDIKKNAPKIGQNVPVKTAEWICSEAVRIIENWETIERIDEGKVVLYDNTKQKKIFV